MVWAPDQDAYPNLPGVLYRTCQAWLRELYFSCFDILQQEQVEVVGLVWASLLSCFPATHEDKQM